MSPTEIGQKGPERLRPVGAVDARFVRNAAGHNEQTTRTQTTAPEVLRSAALDAGSPPIDTERVKVIRKAVENGTYPVLPVRVADAMIAAGFLLIAGKQER